MSRGPGTGDGEITTLIFFHPQEEKAVNILSACFLESAVPSTVGARGVPAGTAAELRDRITRVNTVHFRHLVVIVLTTNPEEELVSSPLQVSE